MSKIRNICDGCCGFIAKDGYCAYCGSYYPDFDYGTQNVEVDETPISINDDVYDCVLMADGERICPIKEFTLDEPLDTIDVTSIDFGKHYYLGCVHSTRLWLTTILTSNTSNKIHQIMNKGISKLEIIYVGASKTNFVFEGYISDYCMNSMNETGLATASFTVVPTSEIIREGTGNE